MKLSNTISPGDVVAVGDIHGHLELLIQFLNWVQGSGAHVVFLGDLIDRGPNDVEVLELVKSLIDNPSDFGLAQVDVIRGNHEQMMLDAQYSTADLMLWVQNGGDVSRHDEIFAHRNWVENLPFYKVIGDTLFVHAGIRPNVPMSKQDEDDLIWIRLPFLNNTGNLAKVFPDGSVKRVVHGHSPINPGNPDIGENRIGIDSGAYFSGVLTAFNATESTFKQFS